MNFDNVDEKIDVNKNTLYLGYLSIVVWLIYTGQFVNFYNLI